MTKVLLGTVRSPVWRQAFQDYLENRGIEIAGPVSDPCELLKLSRDVKVVILSLDAPKTPSACSQLLDNYPDLTIIALAAEGNWGFLFRRAMTVQKVELDSLESLLQLIHSAEQE